MNQVKSFIFTEEAIKRIDEQPVGFVRITFYDPDTQQDRVVLMPVFEETDKPVEQKKVFTEDEIRDGFRKIEHIYSYHGLKAKDYSVAGVENSLFEVLNASEDKLKRLGWQSTAEYNSIDNSGHSNR